MLRLLVSLVLASCSLVVSAQNFNEILGRPTAQSVTMSILFDRRADVYWEYGTSGGTYTMSTPTFTAVPDTALEAVFTGLSPDTRYFYRTRYREAGTTGTFLSGPEHNFNTQRASGTSFSFAVEADPHLDTNSIPEAYALTLQNIKDESPDFMFDLGDTFMSEKLQDKTQQNITARHLLYRPYFGSVCHSVPLFFVKGNHEGENGWLTSGSQANMKIMAANTRKLFYPNPVPDGFYSGDSIPEPNVGLMQNYYSFEWGNSLFIVLDPYWYTTSKPDWGWTLGEEQYNWFRKVITGSKARFKFVFCHQLVGGNGNDGRGGMEFASFFEMGGLNKDSSRGWETNRQGWDKPVHQLMTDNRANIYFHGHDHFFARQELDGVVYQEVPQPSSKNITNANQAASYGYLNGTIIPARGYLLVSVSDSIAKIDYVRTYLPSEENATRKNKDVSCSYTLHASPAGIGENTGEEKVSGMLRNFPNPFETETTIAYRLTQTGQVSVRVYDMLGKEASLLCDQYQQAGNYTLKFNPRKNSSAGRVYYCRITAGEQSETIKMICIQ